MEILYSRKEIVKFKTDLLPWIMEMTNSHNLQENTTLIKFIKRWFSKRKRKNWKVYLVTKKYIVVEEEEEDDDNILLPDHYLEAEFALNYNFACVKDANAVLLTPFSNTKYSLKTDSELLKINPYIITSSSSVPIYPNEYVFKKISDSSLGNRYHIDINLINGKNSKYHNFFRNNSINYFAETFGMYNSIDFSSEYIPEKLLPVVDISHIIPEMMLVDCRRITNLRSDFILMHKDHYITRSSSFKNWFDMHLLKPSETRKSKNMLVSFPNASSYVTHPLNKQDKDFIDYTRSGMFGAYTFNKLFFDIKVDGSIDGIKDLFGRLTYYSTFHNRNQKHLNNMKKLNNYMIEHYGINKK